jgi:hypothetical protein
LFLRRCICGECSVRHPIANRLDVVEHVRKLNRVRNASSVYSVRILNRARTVS